MFAQTNAPRQISQDSTRGNWLAPSVGKQNSPVIPSLISLHLHLVFGQIPQRVSHPSDPQTEASLVSTEFLPFLLSNKHRTLTTPSVPPGHPEPITFATCLYPPGKLGKQQATASSTGQRWRVCEVIPPTLDNSFYAFRYVWKHQSGSQRIISTLDPPPPNKKLPTTPLDSRSLTCRPDTT